MITIGLGILIGIAATVCGYQLPRRFALFALRNSRNTHGQFIERIASKLQQELVEYEYRHGRSYEPRSVIARPHDLPFDPTADHAPSPRNGGRR